MFQIFSKHRRKFAGLALLATLLRVAVPAGFMPASVADGWYLKLCSDGISDAVMMALLGQSDHHHQHADAPGHDSGSGQTFDQCDLGSGFASAAITQAVAIALGIFLVTLVVGKLFTVALSSRPRLYLARAPPLLPIR